MTKPILYLILSISTLIAQPSWFYKIDSYDKNQIIGYGVANTLEQAKQNALADIANSLSVAINSDTSINKSSANGTYDKNIRSNLHIQSQATLSGIQVLKHEFEQGIYYVASSYDTTPLEFKLKKQLQEHLAEKPNNQIQNKYLSQTSLIQNINKTIGLSLDYEIIRKDNLWQIKYQDILLPLSQDNFYGLFTTTTSDILQLKLNKIIYKHSDQVSFEINSRYKGYISILYVEHNGKVGVILSNQYTDGKLNFPQNDSDDTFRVANPYGKPIQELYVAIYSKEPLNLSSLENVSDNYLDKSNYNFHRLLDMLNQYDFLIQTIKIKE